MPGMDFHRRAGQNMINPYAKQQRSNLAQGEANKAEGWALIEMARRMDNACQIPDNEVALRDETRKNWRIWTIIQAYLLDGSCTIPDEIRSNLLNLSKFIDRRSVDILAIPTTAKMKVLININRQIGAGLLGKTVDDPNDLALLEQNPPQTSASPSAGSSETA